MFVCIAQVSGGKIMQRWDQVGKVCLVFLIILIPLLFLFFTTVTVQLSYSRRGRDNKFVLGFSLWHGLICYQFQLPATSGNREKRRPVIKIKIKTLQTYRSALYYLLDKVRLHRFTWQTEIGAGDPAQTGLLTGAAWSVKGLLLTVACRLLSTGGVRPVVKIKPNFEKVCFNTDLSCVFDVRIGYLLVTGFKTLAIKYKQCLKSGLMWTENRIIA